MKLKVGVLAALAALLATPLLAHDYWSDCDG